jgi:fimbrial chaperone protein
MKSTTTMVLSGRLAWTLLFAAICVPPPALAGAFSVTPVRLYMSVRDRAVAVTVTNDADTDVVLQADVNTWQQTAEGEDRLELTDDLILSPPIIKLAPKARQVVRLARLAPPDPSRQVTYRLILREVPEALPAKQNVQVSIALALSLPVFITPPKAVRSLNCRIAGVEEKSVGVRCSNTGTAYAQVREIEVSRGDKKIAGFSGGTYILPGASKTMAAATEGAAARGPVKVVVTFDDSKTQEFELSLP